MEQSLQSIWAHVLNLPDVALDQPFLAVGGDSISAMQVVGQCRKQGICLGVQEVLRSRSIAHLTTFVKDVEEASYGHQDYFDENFDLTPIQYLYFQRANTQGHFNQSFLLQITRPISVADFQSAVNQLVARHSMLRARFSFSTEYGWQQRLTRDIAGSYRFRYTTVTSQAEIDASITDSQQNLDCIDGPLFGADFFSMGAKQYAFLTGHHLVVDLVTWRLLLEELEEILEGGQILTPSMSFQKWAELQKEHAKSLDLHDILPAVIIPPMDFSYWGIQHEENTYGHAGCTSFELGADISAAFLTSCHRAYKTEPVEILLASLLQSWSVVFDNRPIPAIFNESHGREPWDSEIDLTRTVGWFTALTPILVEPSEDPTSTVRKIKDFKRRIPGNGRPYFARRCLTSEGRDHFKSHWPMEILFNYLGQYQQLERADALLKPIGTMAGEAGMSGGISDFGHSTSRWGLFEISAFVFEGHLKVAFTYNRQMEHQDLIQRWISECQSCITEMILKLTELEPQCTISDFPLLSLTEEGFFRMLARLAEMGIDQSNVEDIYPCSRMQEGILVSQAKDAKFYAAATLHEVLSPTGRIDWQKVACGWRQVVIRHPALRTLFLDNMDTQGVVYCQLVLNKIEANIVHLECQDKEHAIQLIEQQRLVTYDNGLCPNHRFTICTTTDNRIFCSLEISHAIMDGHSMSLLVSELQKACQGSLNGQAPPYSDYISWSMKLHQESSLDYWKLYLKGSKSSTFPVLNDGTVLQRKLASLRLDLSSIELPDLHRFPNTNGITLSNIFHAAWALTLSNYIGSPDVSFGYLICVRDPEEVPGVKEIVGPIINTLVCRVNMSNSSRCLFDILQDVQRDYMEAVPHRHVALADVQHELALGGATLFNTALSFRRLPPCKALPHESLRISEVRPIYDPTEYPVSINIEVSDEDVAVDLDYWTDHISAKQAENVGSTFVRALENTVFNARQPICFLDHISQHHMGQIQKWNIMPASIDETVHGRFEFWAVSQPDAPAIRGHDGDFTYAELDAATNRLAHHLVGLGIGPEIFVPTCFDKSCFAIVAMLAVLKAGGAAVPLDAGHPKLALKTRVEDAEARIVLTTTQRAKKFDGLVPNTVVVNEAFLKSLPAVEGSACTTVQPDNSVFVIFTSGSTGKPKGVVLTHSAIVTSAESHGRKMGLSQETRMLQFASYTFDNSLEEIFTTLQRGGCVCVPSEADRFNDLPGAIARLQVNTMDLTPTVASLIKPSDVPTIKSLGLGAEPLTKALIDLWSKHVNLYGQYGPSEASINSAFKDFTHGGEATNIGRANGCVAWLVDPDNHDRLMPIGCTGELLLEGPILSRGYLKDAEKTQASFIMDPKWASTDGLIGRRFYCTGDLVQYTSEGEMIYCGRKDSQVKLHGQRIELGEIEHHIRLTIPASAQCAVELIKFNRFPLTEALVAFLCLKEFMNGVGNVDTAASICEFSSPARSTAKEIELALANVLPVYYIPSMFIPVTCMPMTASGKLDRRVLRALAAAIPESDFSVYRLAGKSGRAPSGTAETKLAQIWAIVLKIPAEEIGAEDSFFRLGGDSIGAIRLVTAAREKGVVLRVSDIFSHAKLKEMATKVILISPEERTALAQTEVVPFELIPNKNCQEMITIAAEECNTMPNAIEDIIPCSKLQEGLIMLSNKDPGKYVVQPIYRLPANVDLARFKMAWKLTVAEEAILRTRIIYTEQYGFLQVVLREELKWHEELILQDLDDNTRRLPVKNGAPLTTFTLVLGEESTIYFVWTAHHAVYDAWSWSSLFRKVEAHYNGKIGNSDIPIPFSQFIKYLTTLDPAESDNFWHSYLDNTAAPQYPQLPSHDYKVEVNGQLLRQIRLIRDSHVEVTVPSIIRAAWGLMLATYSGSDDVIWGETNSGREAPVAGIENIIGPTITTAPVRLLIDRKCTLHEYLKGIQHQSSRCLPYQYAGLQHIRELSSEAAVACDFQSFLGIEAGQSMTDPDSELWNLESADTIGTKFLSYALIFNCRVSTDSLHVEVLYDKIVVEPWLIQRMVDQLEFILHCFTSADMLHMRLSDINLLNSADKELISTWNKTPVEITPRCIHDVIKEDQADAQSEAVAIDGWDTGVMTFEELEYRATVLAHRLLSMGVRHQEFILLCFDKSGWTIVAMLAVLKAGAAFVPLDFEAPVPRLREIVDDVEAHLILCASHLQQLCQSLNCNTHVVDRDSTEPDMSQYPPLPRVNSESRAYAFFTSGSTGKPKGAVVNHYQWVTSSSAFSPVWDIKRSSRVLQFASYTFDACLIEIFSTLMRGGTVCVPDQESRTNDLVGVINKFNVNWAALTPSVARIMHPSQVTGLETLFLVGEAMSKQDLTTWTPKVKLGNGYGPTECAAVANSNIMRPGMKPNNLGRPVTSRGWIVLAHDHQILAPVGAVGELLLEGGAVGAGYLNDPGRTAESFISHVKWSSGFFPEDIPLRIYKTGDLVKYNEDGTMLYLGRKDSQAKVRGQRLELSEVEHHIMKMNSVENAMAAVPKSGPCAKRLVGIMSFRDIAFPETGERILRIISSEAVNKRINGIRDHLYERLPNYMVPSLWIAIHQFPLTPGGKMDRRRTIQWLESMSHETYRVILSATEQTPSKSNGVERKLQEIFAYVLNLPVEDIRPNQSFLHLGGDSIAAMQASSQCRAQALPISVQEIIRSKSIQVLAAAVDLTEQSTPVLEAAEYNLPFDISPIQKVFFETVGDSHNHFNQKWIFRLSRSLSFEELEVAFVGLVSIHPMLRARFFRNETGIWKQKVEKNIENSFRIRQHRVEVANTAALRLIIDDSQKTLDISHGPTFSVDIINCEKQPSQTVALVAHHLVIDVVSWGVLLEDLQSLLNGVKPSPQSLPYHVWLQQQILQAERDYPKQVYPLIDVVPANYDYWGMSNQSNLSGDTMEETFQLSVRDTMLLLGAQNAIGTEIVDILLAALLESFRKVFTDRNVVTIHNEGHGRESFMSGQDLSRTVGWFSTLTPISLAVSSEEATDMINTIQWIKESRERIPGKGRPYFSYRNLTKQGSKQFSSHWPAEVIFNYLGKMQNLDRKDSLITAIEDIKSQEAGDDVPRLCLFDITAAVFQGAIKISFEWNQHMKHQTMIHSWIKQCQQTLIDSIDDLLPMDSGTSLASFKNLPLLYNGTSRLAAALPSGMTISDIEDIYPVSPMQQGILHTQSRRPNLYVYEAIFEVRATDPMTAIDSSRLVEAWQTVIHCHQALRTVFIDSLAKSGTKDQIVLKEKAGRVQFLDVSDDNEVAQTLRDHPYIDCNDLTPPHRLNICQTTSGKVWVKLELSHAINDGTSISIILKDLASAYVGKLTRADTGPLYSDYIGYISSQTIEADVSYWKEHLSGIEPCIFPILNDGKSGTHEPSSIVLHLGSTHDAQAFCKNNNVTLSNVLQLSWALTLHCVVGSPDISFGLVASGRDIPLRNIDEAIGCFINMLVVRVVFSDDTKISRLLEKLQTDSIDALSHQICPLAEIQHALQLNSLFNTAFTFQRRAISRDPEETALLYDNVEAFDPGEYAVTVNADVTDESIVVDFGFWKDNILPSQAQNFVEIFRKMFKDIIGNHDDSRTISELDFMTKESFRKVLKWNMGLPPPVKQCVHEAIHEQVLIRPRATKAVEGWDESFTYQEFDTLTDQVSVHLQANGVTTETLVPILYEKSSWAIISMIGIMKAGGAYVPLDPKHPQSRLRELISDVSARVVLCSRKYHEKATEVASTALIIDARTIAKFPIASGAKPKSLATPENASYCLFTSGTTGKPKGTIITHQAFITSAEAFTRRMNINAASRIFQFASYTFDASCIEILSALLVGATVCVPSDSDRMNDPAGAIRKLKVNWSLLTPSVLGTIEPGRVPSLKTLVSGGESLPEPILKKWGTKKCFINAYGPTECSVVAATSYKSTIDHQLLETDPATIGTGSGARLWVVHPRNHDKLMPVGSIGELIIEGHTVARGYLNDELKTSEAFIKNPTWSKALSKENPEFQVTRMYKSGDLVRYNSDGSIKYIRRKDTQIKLNGQRIELGEIEFHVGKYFPTGIQSVVELIAHSNRSSTKALAVFFTILQHQPIEFENIAQSDTTETDNLLLPMSDELLDMCKVAENGLAASLPSYMIPSIFIPISKMPWTSSGKIDRHRLRNCAQNLSQEFLSTYRLTNVVNKKQPQTDSEKKIQKIVCSVLNLPNSLVGIDDNFVRLGGDSISAMRLVANAQAENLSLSFVDIFKTSNLAALATTVTKIHNTDGVKEHIDAFSLLRGPITASEAVPEISQQCCLPIDQIQDAYQATPMQEALITLSTKYTGAYVAQHVLLLEKSLDISKLKNAWQQAIQEIDILRTRIVQLRSGTFIQAVLNKEQIDWQELPSLLSAKQEVVKLPLYNGSKLASYAFIGTQSRERYFVWTIHHALYDAWTINLILQRVQCLYQSGISQKLPTPYTRFIHYIENSDPEKSIRYWKETFDGVSVYQFPRQQPFIVEKPHNGQTFQHTLKVTGNQHKDVTPSHVIRAAWALVLATYTGSNDVIFGETLSGRDIAVSGITAVCGPVLTTVPTKIHIDRNAKVLDFLREISNHVTDRIPYQHYGLPKMKAISEDVAAACNFQNLLVIHTDQDDLEDSMWSVHDSGEQDSFFTYPLVLECKIGRRSVELLAHYNANLISTWQIQRILSQMESVLGQLNTLSKVSDVQVFSDEDAKLLREWNGYQLEVFEDTVPTLVRRQVTAQPNKIAVCAHDGDLTYSELEGHASMLAQELIEHGAGPETLIPVCLDKSRWAIVGILGVLLAGAAFVPLSPDNPISRHRQIIEACNSTIVVSSPAYKKIFATLSPCVIPVSGDTIQSLPNSPSPIPPRAMPESACYVIFTSGSTGVPKGVVVENRSIVTNAAVISKSLHMTQESRVFQFCSFLFDVSVAETLVPLMCGATICIPSDEQRTTNLAAAITSLGATWAFLTPSVAATLEGPQSVPTLKTLAVGGEAMTMKVVEIWASHVQLCNGYGPTESSVFAVTNDQVSYHRDPLNIGHMLMSGRAWLTIPDDPHRLAPVGAIAELCLEGALLARGYLNDPQGTASSFIDMPRFAKEFSDLGISRIYRTGDLVQYDPNGCMHYIGRKDSQIKLAGQRIEIGEIEHHLQADVDIGRVVVSVPQRGPCAKKLTAVVNLNGSFHDESTIKQPWNTLKVNSKTSLQIRGVRDRLSDVVPSYMVPNVWVPVIDIPSLVSTKSDHKKVRSWLETLADDTFRQILELEREEPTIWPTNTAVTVLKAIWAKALNIPIGDINPNRSWLSLGGDSISAMKLLARCRDEGIHLTLNQVLRTKSLVQLADCIKSTLTDYIDVKETEEPFDLSPVQLFYLQSIDAEMHTHFNQSATMRLRKNIESPAIHQACNSLVASHSMLRARFSISDGQWQQHVSSNIENGYEFREHRVSSLFTATPIISDSQKSLDILKGPVFIVNLFKTSSDDQILFIVAHHLVIDIVSWGIIVGDLENLLSTGSTIKLPKAMPFQVWCDKQKTHAIDVFQQELMRKPSIHVQPADFAFWGMEDCPNKYGDVNRDDFTLDLTTSTMVLNSHNALRTNTVDLILAAILHSFSRIFVNRKTPTIFNESHGREVWASSNIDISRTVGWFTSMYPVTVLIGEEEDDVVHTVRQVKDARRKFADNGRPYFAHRFLTEDGRQRYADHEPMEILFNYTGRQQQSDLGSSILEPVQFTEDQENEISDVGIETNRMALFEISASICQEKIHVDFMYNKRMKYRKNIRRWVVECGRTIEEIVVELSKIEIPQPTISDFPLLHLESYSRLDKLLQKLPSVGVMSYDQVEDIYPCSSIQVGMVLSQIKNPESYWSSTTFEVKSSQGPVDLDKMVEAWQKVVQRHPALRTVFIDSVCKGGMFDQIVVRNCDTGLITYECTDAEVKNVLDSVRYTELNGKRKPALPHQFALIKTDSGKIIAKIIVSHVVIDGASLEIISNDLREAYEGRLPDGEGPSYSNYIQYLHDLPVSNSIQYWKAKLQGIRPCCFPTTAQRTSIPRQLRSLNILFDRWEDLRHFAETSNVTVANILLASWAIVLRTYTESDDVCYGYIASGRNLPIENTEHAVGAFINMLISRLQISSTTSLLDVILKAQTDFIEDVPHQNCSLAQVQHDLGLAGKALFNTSISIQNRATIDGAAERDFGIEFEQLDIYDPSDFVITVNIDVARSHEAVRFAYWSDVVTDGEAKNVSSLLAKILYQVLDNTKQTIAELGVFLKGKSSQGNAAYSPPNKHRPSILRRPSSASRTSSFSSTSPTRPQHINFPDLTPTPLPPPSITATPMELPDWSNLIRSIVNEMVPQIVEQIVAKNQAVANQSLTTAGHMPIQAKSVLARGTSQSERLRPSMDAASLRGSIRPGSVHSRRLSSTSNAESRIQTAANMVASVGVLATEVENGVAPDYVEKRLLSLWSELLELVQDSVKQDDSFFQLGGDSILAMRLVGAAREEGLSISVADVFKNPTFADMSRVVRVAGEVIDEVMSRAGDSITGRSTGGPSRPLLAKRESSLWDELPSVVSEYNTGDHNVYPAEQESTKPDGLVQKWQSGSTQPRSPPHRRGSSVSHLPPTIREDNDFIPKPISLLEDPNFDSVISKVQVFKGGIADILPVTDFQALAITGTLLESKWMLNYFYLDGSGPLDLRKLKQAAYRVVQAFDILRTVFVPYGDRFLQVVLRKLQLDFIFQQIDDNLETFTKNLLDRDRGHGPRLGDAFTKFVVVKQKPSGRFRIFMRLSHAQYDGVCISKILGALQDGYNGLPVSSAPSFGNFVRDSAKTVAGAHDHWKKLLRGSKMTEIVNRFGPNYRRLAGRTITLKHSVAAPKLSRINITAATVVKAAWSAALAHIAGKSDIVFGHVISGRNSNLANIENIVGPCLNMVPVRVVYQPQWTVGDLLGYIQDQQVSNMPFESLGFREIIRLCTDWPDWTNFSSVLQHDQNIQPDKPTLVLGGIEYTIGAVASQEDFADFSIHSTSRGGTQIDVTLTYVPNSAITAEFAQQAFDLLCGNIVSFANDPQASLPSPSELEAQSSATIHPDNHCSTSAEKQPTVLPTDTGLSKHEIGTLANTLRCAWEQILHDDHGAPAAIQLDSDFFQLGGDIMGLAQVASLLDQDGFRVRIEDLLDRSVFVEQVGLLALERKKQIDTERQNPWGDRAKSKDKEKERVEAKGKSSLGNLVKKLGLGRNVRAKP